MANQEHLKLLKQGIGRWNAWREKHPDVRPYLSRAKLNFTRLDGANLNMADLSRADLYGADLSGADLYETNLSRADLSGADLGGAALNGADLSGAALSEANLNGTDLSEANLSRVDLSDANLDGAILDGADLSGACLWHTTFAKNDLRTVKGLTEIEHKGPSHISLHSVKLPQDGSALHFLRGAGIPDEWIDIYRSIMMNPVQYYSCFISVRFVSPKPAQAGGWAGKEKSFYN